MDPARGGKRVCNEARCGAMSLLHLNHQFACVCKCMRVSCEHHVGKWFVFQSGG
jgi:hypothetical protein